MSREERTTELIAQVLDRPGRAAISCSFQPGGVALLHMLRRFEADIPVLFVDTGYHFPETIRFRDRLATEWNLNLQILAADLAVGEWEAARGALYRTDPDRCCAVRKVEPLYPALGEFEIWFTGLRRDQSKTRSRIGTIERKLLPTGQVIEKVNPLADWTTEDVTAYRHRHGIPIHPLHERGYPSIGCAPCTLPSADSEPRAGRWNGRKIECGLHTMAEDTA